MKQWSISGRLPEPILRTIFSHTIQTAAAVYRLLHDLESFSNQMEELEDCLARDTDTALIRHLKNVCTTHKLGPKMTGMDLTTQYLTWKLWGHTPEDDSWANERKKVMEKKHAGRVLHEIALAFGTTIFLLLPPSAPTL